MCSDVATVDFCLLGMVFGVGKIVGTESFHQDSPIPRVIWVVINGMMYKCSPETLRPLAEDE